METKNLKNKILSIQNITKAFNNGKDLILNNINLDLYQGETIALIGKSGSGKTTLLNIISQMEKDYSGEVLFHLNKHIDLKNSNDENNLNIPYPILNLKKLTDKELSRLRNDEIGFIFQFHYLLNDFNLLDNVLIPSYISKKFTDKEFLDKAHYLINKVELKNKLNHFPNQLSGGERQRVALCRALINNPSIVLADEPTGNLDEANTEKFFDLIMEFNQDKNLQTTFLVVTHDMNLANKMGIKIEIKNGSIVKS